MGPATFDPDYTNPFIIPGTNTPVAPPVTPTPNTPQQQFNWMQLISSLGSTFATLAPSFFAPQTGGQFQSQPPVQPGPTFDPTILLLIGLGVYLIAQKK